MATGSEGKTQREEAGKDYARMPTEELLHELEMAGRHPDLALLEALLERREEATPTLLKWLEEELDSATPKGWEGEDPRWYRAIHAGLLLITYREPKAIPLFMEILQNPSYEVLQDWFNVALPLYGPALMPYLLGISRDESLSYWARVSALGILTQIANQYVEVRPAARKLLRELLPVDESGQVTITREAADKKDEDEFMDLTEYLGFLVMGLEDLRDKQSLPLIKALFDAGLVWERIAGDYEEVERNLLAPHRPPSKHRWDLLQEYRQWRKLELGSAPQIPQETAEPSEEPGNQEQATD